MQVWDDVKYCSDRCRNSRGKAKDGVESVQDSYKSARRSFSTIPRTTKDRYLDLFSSSLSLIIAASAPLLASSAAKAAITNRPTTQELLEVFKEWDDSPDDAFSPSDFRRLDESSDTNFYSEPRFVEHIDKKAVEALTKYHDIIIKSSALGDLAPTSSSLNNSRESNTNKIDVLDLCSSWVSHISPTTAQTFIQSAVGIGMNMEELNRNKLLTERVVQDLNKNPSLKNIPENSFDLCLLQLSIDYLTRPVEVMKELARVLKPNGKIVIT